MPKDPDEKTVEGYVASLPPDKAKIVRRLVKLVQKNAPNATASIKWAQPVFEINGPFCYISAFKNYVNFGFWRGLEIASANGKLESGGKEMGHVAIAKVGDIDEELFGSWVEEAVRLNIANGDPTKSKGKLKN
jgi:hypothetical protein